MDASSDQFLSMSEETPQSKTGPQICFNPTAGKGKVSLEGKASEPEDDKTYRRNYKS
jgi:hypothetical protein